MALSKPKYIIGTRNIVFICSAITSPPEIRNREAGPGPLVESVSYFRAYLKYLDQQNIVICSTCKCSRRANYNYSTLEFPVYLTKHGLTTL